MASSKLILPGYGQHIVFLGSTGSGKSTAAEEMLQYYSHYVAVDSQDSLDKLTGLTIRTPAGIKTAVNLFPRLIYKPRPDYLTKRNFDQFFRIMLESTSKKRPRPKILYIDEIYHVGYGASFPSWLPRSITTARQRHLSFWMSTQRPKQIPAPVMSEASRIIIYRLAKEDDIKYAASFARSNSKELYRVLQEQQDDFSFIEINTRTGQWEKKPALTIH